VFLDYYGGYYRDFKGNNIANLCGFYEYYWDSFGFYEYSTHLFYENRAPYKGKAKDGYLKLGYIDYNGNVVIQPQFDVVYPFSEGKAFVKKERTQLINSEGKMLFEMMDGALPLSSYHDGLAIIVIYDTPDLGKPLRSLLFNKK